MIDTPELWTEKEFQARVRAEAEDAGWKVYAVYDSRKTPAGWPDLTLVRGNRLMFWELKREKKSKVSAAQIEWLTALGNAGAETKIYRPSDIEEMMERLA